MQKIDEINRQTNNCRWNQRKRLAEPTINPQELVEN